MQYKCTAGEYLWIPVWPDIDILPESGLKHRMAWLLTRSVRVKELRVRVSENSSYRESTAI